MGTQPKHNQFADIHGVWQKYRIAVLNNGDETYNGVTTNLHAVPYEAGHLHDHSGGWMHFVKAGGASWGSQNALFSATVNNGDTNALKTPATTIFLPFARRPFKIRSMAIVLPAQWSTSPGFGNDGRLGWDIVIKTLKASGSPTTLATWTQTPNTVAGAVDVENSAGTGGQSFIPGFTQFGTPLSVAGDDRVLLNLKMRVTNPAAGTSGSANFYDHQPYSILTGSTSSNYSTALAPYLIHYEGLFASLMMQVVN